MGWVLTGIAILLALVLMFLAVPVRVLFRVGRIKETKGQLTFRWLFGLVRFQVGIPGAGGPEPQRKRTSAKKARKRKPGGNARGFVSLLKQSAFRRHVIGFIKDIVHAIDARGLYLRLRIGLGDPADTGRLWALLGPVAGIASTLRGAEVHVEPEFMDSALEFEGHGELRLVPLQFIGLVLAFFVSPTTLRAWSVLRQSSA